MNSFVDLTMTPYDRPLATTQVDDLIRTQKGGQYEIGTSGGSKTKAS